MGGAQIDGILLNINPTGQLVLGGVLALIIYGVALDLKVADFVEVFRKPVAPISGLLAQLALLPAVTWAITMLLKPQPSIALGMMVVAACPGGNISNLITHMARGNTALSISMTGVSSVLAIVTTPLNILFWAGLNPETNALLRQVSIEPLSFLGQTMAILGIPMALGMLTVAYLPKLADFFRRPLQILSFLFLVAFIGGAMLTNSKYLSTFVLAILPFVILHNAIAVGLGWGTAKVLRLSDFDTRALTIEVSMHNSGLGLALILNQFDGVGGAALVAAGWGVWHLISGWALAEFWKRRDPHPKSRHT